MTPHLRFWLAVAVLGIAAGLRLWGLASVPPGVHYDEAFHLLEAQKILRGEAFPIYITGNQGNEPLMAYLSVITLFSLGPVAWAGRLVSAWAGLVCVAATIRVGNTMFPRQHVGWLAGLALAGLYWHLNFSRFGTQPMLSGAAAAATMAGLGSGARQKHWAAYVLGGLGLGLGLNAYVAFRLFPVVPLLGGLGLLWQQRTQRRAIFQGGLLMALTALAVYAPLAYFFWQNPQWFFNRYAQITSGTLGADNGASALWDNALAVAGGLFFQGDTNWRQNLPGRPGLDVAQSVAFIGGLWLCLRQWRRAESWTLLAWVIVGLLPSVLTEFPPQFIRTVMATPALALVMGVGYATLFRTKWRARWLVIGALLFSTLFTANDYFLRWANDPALFRAFDVGLQWLAQQLRAVPGEARLYETPVYREWPTLEYTLGADAYARFKTFDGRQCVVVPETTTQPAAYAIILPEDSLSLPMLTALFPTGHVTQTLVRDGAPHTVIYTIPAGQTAQLPIATISATDFGDLVTLRSYTRHTPFAPGESLNIQVAWRANAPTTADYKVSVALLGPPQADGNRLYAQRDAAPCNNTYPTWQWAPGEIVVDYVSLSLPADLPPATYQLVATWYDAVTLARLPAHNAAGPLPDNLAPLDSFSLAP